MRVPGLYMPAHDLIVGDLIVHGNRVLEIGRIKRAARFVTFKAPNEKGLAYVEKPAQTPIFELWPPGEVTGDPLTEWGPPCIDEQVRVHKAASPTT